MYFHMCVVVCAHVPEVCVLLFVFTKEYRLGAGSFLCCQLSIACCSTGDPNGRLPGAGERSGGEVPRLILIEGICIDKYFLDFPISFK